MLINIYWARSVIKKRLQSKLNRSPLPLSHMIVKNHEVILGKELGRGSDLNTPLTLTFSLGVPGERGLDWDFLPGQN